MHALIFFMISFSFKTREDEDEDNLLEKRRRSSSSSFSYSSSSPPSALHVRGMYVPASAAKNRLECQEGVLLLAEKPRNTRIPESEEEAGGDDDDDDDEGSEEDVATARTVAAIPEPRVREISPEGRRRMCRAPLLAAAISSSTRRKEKLRVKSGQKRRFFSCMTPHSQAA
jgi:hypothetical protein